MGFFSKLFGKKSMYLDEQVAQTTAEAPATTTVEVQPEVKKGILNLKKGGILNLNKDEVNLSKLRVACGWDVNDNGRDYDLDLCAITRDADNRVLGLSYYGDKKSMNGALQLDKDNLTGEDSAEKINGLADDETIFVDLEKMPANAKRVEFYVVIYQGKSRNQNFSKVQNAFARLWDDGNDSKEVVRFTLSGTNDSRATAVHVLNLNRDNGWTFEAVERYMTASISEISNQSPFR